MQPIVIVVAPQPIGQVQQAHADPAQDAGVGNAQNEVGKETS